MPAAQVHKLPDQLLPQVRSTNRCTASRMFSMVSGLHITSRSGANRRCDSQTPQLSQQSPAVLVQGAYLEQI